MDCLARGSREVRFTVIAVTVELVKYLLTQSRVNNVLLFATVHMGKTVWHVPIEKDNLWALE
jgi:hypothetical protein